jgi:hypothetical protein
MILSKPTRTERRGSALTFAQRRELAARYWRGLATQAQLAASYGVSQGTVARYCKMFQPEKGQ